MSKSKTIPKFASYEEAGEWLDLNSTAEVETTQADFELENFFIRIIDSLGELKTSISLDQALSKQISKIANKEEISWESLINNWLKEKVQSYKHLIKDES